jgi:hypothetical protein
MMNPIQGIVRGEVILDGDASQGIDLTLYAVTVGWDAVPADSGMLATGGSSSEVSVSGGNPFTTSMVGKTITFVESGSAMITFVVEPNRIQIDRIFPLMVNEAFTMDGQESLRVIELDENDELHVTDVFISQEKDSKYAIVVGEDVPGQRLAKGRLLETGSINCQLKTPFVSRGILKYYGHDVGLNVCLINGYIT